MTYDDGRLLSSLSYWVYSGEFNQWTGTKFNLDLYFLVNNLHMKYQLYICISSRVRLQKLRISHFFQSSRGTTHQKIKNHRITTFNLNLYIPMTHTYIKFELFKCVATGCWDNDWKVDDEGMTKGWNDGTV